MTPSQMNGNRCPYGRAFDIFCAMLAQETDECIVWPYTKDNSGHGIVRLSGTRDRARVERAHNLAWILTHKEQLGPAYIRHQCNNPACFNPRHLKKDVSMCKTGQGITMLLKLSNRDTDECVLWPYHLMLEGRGKKRTRGRGLITWKGQKMSTNRAAWLANGKPLKENEVVCHSCDNPPCVNLKHLFAGTQKENIEDCIRKGRKVISRGVLHNRSVLTEEQVKEIRTLYRPGVRGLGRLSLARRYGLAKTTVSQLLEGKTWKHLL
jgi:hypothetical protein